jgi:hypothetical protein
MLPLLMMPSHRRQYTRRAGTNDRQIIDGDLTMPNFFKDDRERSPKEQAAAFVASIGAIKRQSLASAEIAQDLSDLLLKVAKLPNSAATARACSQAVAEWADVRQARPDHANELAKLAAKSVRGIRPEAADYARAGLTGQPTTTAAAQRPAMVRRMTP